MRKLAVACLWTLVFTAIPVFAEKPTVSVSVYPPVVPYHLPVTVEYTMEGLQETEFSGPQTGFDAEGFEVRPVDEERESLPDGGMRLRKRYVIDSIRPGVFQWPGATFEWHVNGESGVLETMPVILHFRDLEDDELEAVRQFYGITPSTAVLTPRRISPWHVIAGVLGTLLIAVALYAFFRRRAPHDVPAPVLTPWEVALGRLRELRRRNLPEKGNIEAYYVDLSAILRYYLEDRFHLHAPEQTTQEFLEDATRAEAMTDAQQAFLAAFLHQCDRIKFACLMPDISEIEEHFSAVKSFVKDTIPSTAPPDALETAA